MLRRISYTGECLNRVEFAAKYLGEIIVDGKDAIKTNNDKIYYIRKY
jgi:hypothetical protein